MGKVVLAAFLVLSIALTTAEACGSHHHVSGGEGGDLSHHGNPRRHLLQAPSPAPLGAGFLPPNKTNSLSSNITASPGANPAIKDSTCGTTVPTVALSLLTNLYREGASSLQSVPAIKNLTSSWKKIFAQNPLKFLSLYGELLPLAKSYFNWTLPQDVKDLPSFLEQLAKGSTDSALGGRRRRLLQDSTTFEIPVYYHVIRDGSQNDGGGTTVTIEQLQQQTAVLNAAYGAGGFTFTTAGTYGYDDAQWYNGQAFEAGSYSTTMEANYHQGSPEALNVYARLPGARDLPPDRFLLGQARFPWFLCSNGAVDDTLLAVDGVRIWWGSLPGQSKRYTGDNLVHEVGHWLGLQHTFGQPASCDPASGDGLESTPNEFSAYNVRFPEAGSCDLTVDSCPDAGTDPIMNYMDYSDDVCKSEFTTEQLQVTRYYFYYIRQNGVCDLSSAGSSTSALAGTPGATSPPPVATNGSTSPPPAATPGPTSPPPKPAPSGASRSLTSALAGVVGGAVAAAALVAASV